MKHQVLFSLKSNEKIFMNVNCCSLDWRFKDEPILGQNSGLGTYAISVDLVQELQNASSDQGQYITKQDLSQGQDSSPDSPLPIT